MIEFEQQVHSLLAGGEISKATTLVLRTYGEEVLGFLYGVLPESDAEEVFSAVSERLWRSLAGFQGRCTVRTWLYVLARRELGRFRKGMRKHVAGRVPISELQDILVNARTRTRSVIASDRQRALTALRDALPVADRTLLILRIDRNLSWDEIALAFADDEAFSDEDRKREAARLRKRFQLIKQRLVAHLRETTAG